MSVTRKTIITCNGDFQGCERTFTVPGREELQLESAAFQRKHFAENGWILTDGMDLCPACRAASTPTSALRRAQIISRHKQRQAKKELLTRR